MPRHRLRLYVRSARLTAGLSIAELAALIGYSEDFTGKCERGERTLPFEFALGCMIVFGLGAAELFPDFYETIHDKIGIKALTLDETLRGRTDPKSLKKLRLLKGIADRAIDLSDI